jgi:hypothetical protein
MCCKAARLPVRLPERLSLPAQPPSSLHRLEYKPHLEVNLKFSYGDAHMMHLYKVLPYLFVIFRGLSIIIDNLPSTIVVLVSCPSVSDLGQSTHVLWCSQSSSSESHILLKSLKWRLTGLCQTHSTVRSQIFKEGFQSNKLRTFSSQVCKVCEKQFRVSSMSKHSVKD